MTLAKKHKKLHTYADYLQWDDSLRAEIINGEIFDMTPAPSREHREISIALSSSAGPLKFIDQNPNGCGCQVAKNDVIFVSEKWEICDYLGAIRCRLGGFRDRYKIQPGLYAVGNPDRVCC